MKDFKDMELPELMEQFGQCVTDLESSVYGVMLEREYGGRPISYRADEYVRYSFLDGQLANLCQYVKSLDCLFAHVRKRIDLTA